MLKSFPSLKSLRAFESVARHLSYQRAADELQVTPAAVKHLVSRLEDAMGGPLLARRGRGLILTSMGRAGLQELSVGMQHLHAGVARMREMRCAQQIIVSVEPSFASAWLVPRLLDFQRQHPEVTVLIDSSIAVVDLKDNAVDVAIRYGQVVDEDLAYHRLFDDCIAPACSPALAATLPAQPSLDDLRHVPVIHWDTTQLKGAHLTQQWFVWENWLSHFGASHLAPKTGLHFSDYNQALQAAIAGHGVALVSVPILKDMFQRNLLTMPFAEKAQPSLGYDLVMLKQANDDQASGYQASGSRALGLFVKWILSTVSSER